jgi:hypothetical protein
MDMGIALRAGCFIGGEKANDNHYYLQEELSLTFYLNIRKVMTNG